MSIKRMEGIPRPGPVTPPENKTRNETRKETITLDDYVSSRNFRTLAQLMLALNTVLPDLWRQLQSLAVKAHKGNYVGREELEKIEELKKSPRFKDKFIQLARDAQRNAMK